MAARTLVFYEAPHRILETLADLEAVWGPALRVVVARELTKIHEEFLRGTVADARRELAARDRIRGEITLLVDARPLAQGQAAGAAPQKIADRIRASWPRAAWTRRKPSSALRASWASPRVRFIANCSGSGRGGDRANFLMVSRESVPSGAKALFVLLVFSARLKSCPFKTALHQM